MAVFVDDMYRYPIGRFRRMKMSHLIADTEAELHAMAAKIGVARKWYQRDHYDICMSKRALAIGFGAVEITYMQCGLMCAVRRVSGALPAPDQAEELWRRHYEEIGALPKRDTAPAQGVAGQQPAQQVLL